MWKNQEENISRRIIFFLVAEKKDGEGGKYLEKENIFFVEEKKTGERKGGKYLEKDNIFFVEERKHREGK